MKNAAAKIMIDDRPFRKSHFASPKGRGSWGFSLDPNPDVLKGDIRWSPSMTYGDAKKWAKTAFDVPAGVARVTIYVLP